MTEKEKDPAVIDPTIIVKAHESIIIDFVLRFSEFMTTFRKMRKDFYKAAGKMLTDIQYLKKDAEIIKNTYLEARRTTGR